MNKLQNRKHLGNTHDLKFYEKISILNFEELATLCGVDDNCDIERALDFLEHHIRIIDIGGGYGRILNFLQEKRPLCSLATIEASPKLAQYLRLKNMEKKIPIYEGNILDKDFVTTLPKFDTALIMWGTFLSFS